MWQSIRASATVLPINIQDWFPLGLTGLILQSKGLSRVFSSITVRKPQFFGTQPSLWVFFFPYQHLNTTLEFFTTPAGVCATYCFSSQISTCSHTSSWVLLKFSQEDPSGLPIKDYVIPIPPPTCPLICFSSLIFFDLKNYLFIFNWLMIGLQYCFDFCHTSTWISHRCAFVPSLLSLPPTSRPFPPL